MWPWPCLPPRASVHVWKEKLTHLGSHPAPCSGLLPLCPLTSSSKAVRLGPEEGARRAHAVVGGRGRSCGSQAGRPWAARGPLAPTSAGGDEAPPGLTARISVCGWRCWGSLPCLGAPISMSSPGVNGAPRAPENTRGGQRLARDAEPVLVRSVGGLQGGVASRRGQGFTPTNPSFAGCGGHANLSACVLGKVTGPLPSHLAGCTAWRGRCARPWGPRLRLAQGHG